MNKIIKGKQCTIHWHVDDMQMSHADYDIGSSILSDINAEYGKIAKMTITRGKIHKYLRMTINYSFTGKVIFSMVEYSRNMIYDYP